MKIEGLAKIFVAYFIVALVGVLAYPSMVGLFGWLGATVGTATVIGLAGVVLDKIGITKAIGR